MITLLDSPVVLTKGNIISIEQAKAQGIDTEAAKAQTIASRILDAHSMAASDDGLLHIRFDALGSHDITYVSIIQTARASGLDTFPVPYVLTNCHNSLCAVGGTINEDDHVFGLSAAKKYGGNYVPANVAVIHQYMREMMAGCGRMILCSDSHTRYGALGTLGFGEGGPELVKQLLGRPYLLPRPQVVLVWLENEVIPGVGPQDIALQLIASTFSSKFLKNKIVEFAGPGLKNLSVEFRSGIDVMTTETTCLSSIWETDEQVLAYLALHGRPQDYRLLTHDAPATFDACIRIDLSSIRPMIALPFHPSNAYPIEEVLRHPYDLLGEVDEQAKKLFGAVGSQFRLRSKIRDGHIWVDQGIIAGCAGGSFENLSLAASIIEGHSIGNSNFSFSVYPASQPQALALVRSGAYSKLMAAGTLLKPSFCGPCFGAGDTPAHGAFSIRHSTRNFPNREGSKPGAGQASGVALMDARSIAATAANGGRLTPATECDWNRIPSVPAYQFDPMVYATRCYQGFKRADPDQQLKYGPNITDWPSMPALPEHLLLVVASIILDPVTTTDELIPSGETSSLRSNPLKLADFTLSRRDPAYLGRAKNIQEMERRRNSDPALMESLRVSCAPITQKDPSCYRDIFNSSSLASLGIGSTIFALKPGDGSAREQAASCQKVLGAWANIAEEYATKRYRSNLINWGIIPFVAEKSLGTELSCNDLILVPHIKTLIAQGAEEVTAWLVHKDEAKAISLRMPQLTQEERNILLKGCLINEYAG